MNHMNVRRGSSGARIARLFKIYRRLFLRHPSNCPALAREFGVDVRTIKRDIDFLKSMPLEIAYNTKARSYQLFEHDFMASMQC